MAQIILWRFDGFKITYSAMPCYPHKIEAHTKLSQLEVSRVDGSLAF